VNFSATNLRSVIDAIALEVAEPNGSELAAKITDRALSYILRLRREQRNLSERDIERITEAVVGGVLRRLLQIANSGGQIGRA
jgi:hypothetical protein